MRMLRVTKGIQVVYQEIWPLSSRGPQEPGFISNPDHLFQRHTLWTSTSEQHEGEHRSKMWLTVFGKPTSWHWIPALDLCQLCCEVPTLVGSTFVCSFLALTHLLSAAPWLLNSSFISSVFVCADTYEQIHTRMYWPEYSLGSLLMNVPSDVFYYLFGDKNSHRHEAYQVS